MAKRIKGEEITTKKRGKQIMKWFVELQKEDIDRAAKKMPLAIKPLQNLMFNSTEIGRFLEIDLDKQRYLMNLENNYYIIDMKKGAVIDYGRIFDYNPAPHYEQFVV